MRSRLCGEGFARLSYMVPPPPRVCVFAGGVKVAYIYRFWADRGDLALFEPPSMPFFLLVMLLAGGGGALFPRWMDRVALELLWLHSISLYAALEYLWNQIEIQ